MPGQREEPRGRASPGPCRSPGPSRGSRAARRRRRSAPESIAIDPIGRGEAALQAVLGEQDRDPPLLVEPAQQPDQLVAGDRVELGGRLVEQDQARAGDQRRGERDPLQLAAGEGVDGALEQVRDREGQGDLLDRAGAGGGRVAAHLQRQPDLGRDRGRDDLGLGVLGEVADDRGQLAGAGGDRVDAGDLDPALDLAAVEVRARGRRRRAAGSTCRRPSGRRAGRTRRRRPRARRSARAGAGGVRVAVGEAGDRERRRRRRESAPEQRLSHGAGHRGRRGRRASGEGERSPGRCRLDRGVGVEAAGAEHRAGDAERRGAPRRRRRSGGRSASAAAAPAPAARSSP